MSAPANSADERELLPCPFCGHPEPVYRKQDSIVSIGCVKCGTEGPLSQVLEFAADFWNKRAGAAPVSGADERKLQPVAYKDQCVTLWQAMRAIKFGNPTDDKLIVKELNAAGFCIAAFSQQGNAK